MNNRQAWNINAIFLILLFGLAAATLLRPKSDFSERENRSLAMLPAPSAGSVLSGEFEQAYEEYLTDQFILRDRWIGLRSLAETLSLKKEIHDVYLADDGYLIEKHPGIFATQTAQSNIGFLSDFVSKAAAELGEDHVSVMLVPNAVDILRQKLPPFASPYDEETYLARIRERIPAASWFDAAGVLRQHETEEIYYRTDHHWTSYGAYLVFREWMNSRGYGQIRDTDYDIETVTDSFEGTVAAKTGTRVKQDRIQVYHSDKNTRYVLTYNQTDDVRSSMFLPGALETRDKYAYFFGGNYGLIEAETKADTDRRLLVIKDSYAHCFAPLLMDWFDQVDFVDMRYFTQRLSEFMEEKDYTDILILQNAAGFAEDTSLNRLAM